MQPADDLHRLASDLSSSATALVGTAYRLLRDARDRGREEAEGMAVAVVRAQPSMASMWNLAAASLGEPAALDRIYQRALRAPSAVARYVGAAMGAPAARRVVTCSNSAAVASAVRALHQTTPLVVSCAESRPACEGRTLAASLAAEGVTVEVLTDAAIAVGLGPGDLVLVGADAVADGWFVNKAGTGQLCAAAALASVPAYAVAGREKFLTSRLAAILPLRDSHPADVWRDAPSGVSVRNPLFERVPIDHVAGVFTDAGLLAGDMIAAACETVVDSHAADRLRRLVLSS
jgi:translation initiation factor 2B subunit (eIF-2B alpha/beta/delta family)